MAGAEWQFRAVTPETWADMAALFEGRGGPKTCWCMVWRKTPEGRRAPAPAPERRGAMEGLVRAGAQVGLLGYDGDVPVAWCSLAPRESFGASLSGRASEPGLWSLTCFFIRADHRGQAGFAALLAAAEDFARRQGARAIESYPVDPDSPSYRFSGFLPAFQAAGYRREGQVGSRRHVLRKGL